MDRPYWETEGYGVPFGIEQYVRMASVMRAIKGRAILTVNDLRMCVTCSPDWISSGSKSGIRSAVPDLRPLSPKSVSGMG